MSINFNDIAILNIQGVDSRCIINSIRKCDTVNVLQNADLTEEKVVLWKKFITIYKMSKKIITFDDITIEKQNFHSVKYPISIYDVKIDKVVVCINVF